MSQQQRVNSKSFHHNNSVVLITCWITTALLVNCVCCFQYRNITSDGFMSMRSDSLHKNFRTEHTREARREPRFISFDTKDNEIEVEMSFNIPFVSIPIKKSLDGAQDLATAVMQGTPLANINLGAIAMAAILGLAAVWLGGFSKVIQGGFFNFGSTLKNMMKSNINRVDDDESTLQMMLNNLDRSLQKYDIDTTACTQRIVCWVVKNASMNVADGKATTTEKIVNGLSSASWMAEFMSGTAVQDAVTTGKSYKNCQNTFHLCKLNSNLIQRIVNSILSSKNRTAK